MTGRIPYYTVRNGRGYWEPRGKLKALGAAPRSCGQDGERARRVAQSLNEQWMESGNGLGAAAPKKARDTAGFVYFIFAGERVKIGFSKKPAARLDDLKTGISEPIRLFVALAGSPEDERRLHDRFFRFRKSGEWFAVSPTLARFVVRSAAFSNMRAALNSEPIENPISETSEKASAEFGRRSA